MVATFWNHTFYFLPDCFGVVLSLYDLFSAKIGVEYKADQYAAHRRWCEKNPDYWKQYRASHPDYRQRNRQQQKERNRKRGKSPIEPEAVIAKRYALKPHNEIISGIYTIVPVNGEMIAKSDALLVKLDVITGNYVNGP